MLPEAAVKTVEAKRLLKNGEVHTMSEAARAVGISRSVFYKYKDKVHPFYDRGIDRTVTLYAQLQRNLVQINSLKEPDLCSSDIVRDRVFISTVHKAKGLEFDNVIVTSVIDGTYPFFKNHDKADILEDARKLYVAISRTKRTLVLTMPAANAWNYAQRPSRFLESISTYFEKSSA